MTLLNLTISFWLICSVCFATTSQNIVSDAKTDIGVALINEEIRRLGEDIDLRGSQITTIANSGFGIVLAGDAEVATDVIPSRYYLPVQGTITKIIAYAKTAPSGSTLIIDVNINGSTALGSSKLNIASGNNSVTMTSFENPSFYADDYLTVDIDQVGSTTAGADIVLSFYVEKTV